MIFIQRLSDEALQRHLHAARMHLEHCQAQYGANHPKTFAAQRAVSNYEQEIQWRQPTLQEVVVQDVA